MQNNFLTKKKTTPLPASSASIRLACSIDISAIEMHVTPILWQYMLRWRQYWEKSAWTVAPDTESASTPAQPGVTAEPKLVAEAPESTRIDTDEKGALEGLSVGGTTHHQAFFAASRNRSARDQDGVSPRRLRPKLSALSVSAELELGMETFLIEMHWRGADATLELWSPTDPPARLTAVSAGLEAAFGLCHRLAAPVPWRVSLATHAPQVQVSQRVADQEPIVLLSPFALRGSLHVQRRADHGESAAAWAIRCGLYTSAFDAILRYQDLELWRTWIRQWSSLLTTSASLPRAIARSVATATASSFPSDTDRIRKAREVSEPSAATCTTTTDAAASSTEMINALKSPQRRDAVAPWNWSALWSALSAATAGSLWTPTQETRRISTLDSRPCIHSTTPKAHPNGNQRSISTSSMSPQLNTVITLWDSATQLQCVLQLDETLPAYVLVLASPESASANDLAPVFRSFLVQRVDPDDETLFVLQPCERSGDSNGWPLPGALGTLNRSGLDPITRLNENIRIGDNPARRETIGRSRREPSSKVRERPVESRSPDGAPLESEPLAILGSSWRSGAPPSSTSTVSDANMIITSEPLVWRACLVTPDGFCLMNAKTGSFWGWNARGQAIQTSQPETVVRLGSSLSASAGARELTAAPQEHPDELTTGAAATSGVSVSFRLESAGALVRLANGGTTGDRCVLPLVALSMSQIELMWQGTGDRQEMQTQCTFALDAYHAGLDTYQPRLHPCRLQLRMQRHTASGLARLWLSPLYREPIRIQGSEQDLLELLVLGEYFGGRRASLPPEYQRAFLFTNDTDAEIEVLPAERSTLRETRSDANLYERALESKVSLPAGNAIGECWESTRIAANAENVSLVVPPSWTPHALWRVSMDRFGRPQVHGASSETRRLQLGVRLGSLPTFRTRWFQWSLDRDTPVATAMDTSADRKALVGRQRDPTWSQTGGSEYARGSPQNPPTVQAQSIELGPDRDTLQIRPRHQTADASDSDLEADEPVASASAALWKRVHWQATQSRTGWSFCLQAPVAVHNACSRTPLRIRCLGLSLDTKDRAHVDNTRIIAPQSSLHIGAVVDIRALTVSFVDARDEETSTDADWCESFSVQAGAMRELYGGSVCIAHMVHWPDNRALRVARHVQDDGTIQVWLSPILEFRNLLPVPALVTINEHIVLLESRSRQELFRFPADGRCELAVSVGEVLLERRQYVTRFQLSDREHVESLTQPQPASKVALFSQLVDSPQGYVEASCYLGVAARNAVMLLSSLYTVFNMVPGMSIQVQESGQIPEHERLPPRALSVEPFQAAFLRTSCCRVFGWREPVRLDLVTAQGYFLRLQGIPLALSFATSYDQEQLERSRWYSDIEESGANWVSGTDHTRAKAGAARSFALRPEIVLINELVDTELVVRRAYPSPSADSDPTLVLPPGSMQPFLFPVYAARDFAGNAVAREKAPADSAALQIRVARRPAVGERLQTAKPQPVLVSNAAAATSTRGEAEPQGPDRNTNGTLSWSGALPLAVTGSFVVDMADGLPGMLTVNAFLERGGCQVVRFQATSADAIPFQLVNGTHKLLCFVQASDRDRALQLLNAQSHRIHWAPPLAQIAFAFCEPLEERTLCIVCLDTDPPICFFLPELEAAFLDAPDEAVSNRFVDECQGQSPWHAPDQQAWQRRLIADPGIQSQHSPVLWVRMRATPTYRLLEFFSDTSEGCTEDTSRESASSALRDDGYEMGTPHLNWIRRVHLFVLVPELVVDVHATAAVGGARVGLCLRDLQVATDLDLDTESRHHMQVSLQSIELRNQAPDTPFPVVIRSGVAEDDSGPNQVEPMALEAELVLRRRFGELECAPLRVMVAPVLLHLDAHFLAQSAALSTALSHEWATLHTKTAETPTRGSTGGVSVTEAPAPLVWMPELAAGPRPGASRYGLTWLVLAYLRLTPIDIRLSFHRGTLPRSPDALAGATVLARAAYLSTRERMVTMPSIDGANLQLAGLELRRYPLTSSDELFVLVWSRWTRSILNQWYKLLGSLEVIGAPLAASRSPVTQLREVYSSLMAGRSTARRFSYGAYSAVSAAERVSIDAAQPATQAMARTAGALGLRLLARGLKRLGSGKDTATRERGRNVPNISGRPIDATGLTSSVHAFSDSVPVETITATIDDATSASEGAPLIRWDDDDDNNNNDAGNHDLVTRGVADVSRSMDLRQTLLYPSV
ncbi:hypothetical protein F1559_000161 [Cyanidiococcus yangmingshanensis]|uniref:Uncharacterized protein n=1 Tax=Cyanidiococcus yangmingshanensis TaxID=2690220 RepID=A0A7J7IHQ2_9RHOD|nr:hypothetical protein F1559_000161 [Cyanidiococcus yangmingshanensis]